MAKLYFKFGAMGSSKSASALMCRFNYIQKGMRVLVIKPDVDTRDFDENGNIIIKSRIGLSCPCCVFSKTDDLISKFKTELKESDVVIVDECQFLTAIQVDQLKIISFKIPVLCYGLKTNFKTHLFEGSKRLLEIADSISEIKSICKCGKKATINARFVNGKISTNGNETVIGGDDGQVYYEGMCYECYLKHLKESKWKNAKFAQDSAK